MSENRQIEASDPELLRLLAALCDESLTSEESARLAELIESSPAARQRYIEYLHLDTCLAYEGAGSIGDDRTESTKPAVIPAPIAPLPESPLFPGPVDPMRGWLPRIGFLVMALLVATFGYLAFRNTQGNLVAEKPEVNQPKAEHIASTPKNQPDATPAAPTTSTGVARLTGVWDALWDEKSPGFQSGDLLQPGQRLSLTGGLAEVTFECGAVVILQSPATFVVESAHGASLEAGRLAARVPGPAAKFWVKTPSMNVFDLGTEFGVSVESSGLSKVRVFEGAVEVEPVSAGSPAPSASVKNTNSDRKLILAGQMGLVEPQKGYSEKLVDIDPNEQFVREMPNNFVEDYAAAIKSSRPWGYWTFNSVITSTLIPDMSGHGRFGQLSGDAMVVQGRSIMAVGQAVALDGDGDSVVIPTGTSLSLNGDFTIETLFRSNTTGPLVTKMPTDGSWKPGAKILFLRGGDVRFTPCIKGAKPRALIARVNVNDGLWHHVVLTNKANVSGKRDQTILYVDGVERNRISNWDITSNSDEAMPIKLGVACHEYPVDNVLDTPQLPTRTFLTGHLDESAVYERCLSADEVVAHYRAYIRAGMATRGEPTSVTSLNQSSDREYEPLPAADAG